MKTRKKIYLSSEEMSDDEDTIYSTIEIAHSKGNQKIENIQIQFMEEYITENESDLYDDPHADYTNISSVESYNKKSISKTEIGDKCEFINFIQGNLKLFVNGHSYLINRTCDNIFYWQCDHNKDCVSQAVTMLYNEEHFLKTVDEHGPGEDTFYTGLEKYYEKCQCITINRNGSDQMMLIRNGYFYNKCDYINNIYYWACEKMESCSGKIITIFNNGEHFVKISNEHNHFNDLRNYKYVETEDYFDIEKEEFVEEVNENEKEIICEYENTFDPEVNLYMSKEKDKNNIDENDLDASYSDYGEDPLTGVTVIGDVDCDFVLANQGNPKLSLNGYLLNFNRVNNKQYYWSCEEKKSLKCYGFAVTEIRDDKHYLRKTRQHNHEAVKKSGDQVKKKCLILTKPPASEIANKELLKSPEDIRKLGPQRKRRLEIADNIVKHKPLLGLYPKRLRRENILDSDTIGKICEIVESTKDYLFTRNQDTANSRGYTTTVRTEDAKRIQDNNTENTHRIEIATIINRIKERARTTQHASTKIYDEEIKNVSDKLKTFIPNREAILCLINRHRRKSLEQKKLRGQNIPEREKSPPKILIKKDSLTEDHFHETFVEPGSEVETITTHKGTSKLYLNGYLYLKSALKNNVQQWQCDKRKLNNCRGHATTLDANGKHFLRTTGAHNHLASAGNQWEIADTINRIKEICLISDDGPKKIYDDVVKNLPNDLKAVLPSAQAITMIIKRHRRKFRPLDKSGLSFHPHKIYPPEIVEIVDRMKQKILTTTEGPARVYNAEIANLSPEIRQQLPKRENLLQTLKRTKRKSRLKEIHQSEEPAYEDDSGGDDDLT